MLPGLFDLLAGGAGIAIIGAGDQVALVSVTSESGASCEIPEGQVQFSFDGQKFSLTGEAADQSVALKCAVNLTGRLQSCSASLFGITQTNVFSYSVSGQASVGEEAVSVGGLELTRLTPKEPSLCDQTVVPLTDQIWTLSTLDIESAIPPPPDRPVLSLTGQGPNINFARQEAPGIEVICSSGCTSGTISFDGQILNVNASIVDGDVTTNLVFNGTVDQCIDDRPIFILSHRSVVRLTGEGFYETNGQRISLFTMYFVKEDPILPSSDLCQGNIGGFTSDTAWSVGTSKLNTENNLVHVSGINRRILFLTLRNPNGVPGTQLCNVAESTGNGDPSGSASFDGNRFVVDVSGIGSDGTASPVTCSFTFEGSVSGCETVVRGDPFLFGIQDKQLLTITGEGESIINGNSMPITSLFMTRESAGLAGVLIDLLPPS